MSTQADIKQFVQKYAPITQKLQQQYGMPSWALLSQAAHETDYGTSNIAKKYNNFGGIGVTGKNSTPMAFNTPEESLAYMARVQTANAQQAQNQWMNQRYAPTAAILKNSNDPQSVFDAMQKSGWAADPNYGDDLMTRYNQMKPYLNNVPAQPVQPTPSPMQSAMQQSAGGAYNSGNTNFPGIQQIQQYQQQADQNLQNRMNQQMSTNVANQPGYQQAKQQGQFNIPPNGAPNLAPIGSDIMQALQKLLHL